MLAHPTPVAGYCAPRERSGRRNGSPPSSAAHAARWSSAVRDWRQQPPPSKPPGGRRVGVGAGRGRGGAGGPLSRGTRRQNLMGHTPNSEQPDSARVSRPAAWRTFVVACDVRMHAVVVWCAVLSGCWRAVRLSLPAPLFASAAGACDVYSFGVVLWELPAPRAAQATC